MATKGQFSLPRRCEEPIYKRDADFPVVFRMIVARRGFSLSGIAYAMGYKSSTTITAYIRQRTRWSRGKRNLIEAARDLGATRDEMAALIAAYIRDTGDTSFVTSREGRRRIAEAAVEVLDSEGELYRHEPFASSHVINPDRLRRYMELMYQHKLRGTQAAARARAKRAQSA